MTDRWQELRTLFDQLLELQNVEREARLREIGTRDAALRARLEAMLGVDEDAVDRLRDYEQAAARSILAATTAGASGDPLGVVGLLKGTEPTDLRSDEPIGSGATSREGRPVGRIGQRIGAWRLIEEIGHGGMGVVYLAERADGQFEQRVAVKLLRFGLTMEDLVARFHTERKILATLQHAHIARLLDGGVVDGGTPWFAMEYVEGDPITQYCNAHGLSIDERLHLFVKVCRVVQHAHNHLVIHRDLKPSNILVTKEGEPRLLDFGLAKVLEDRSGEVSSTRPGRRWMTLEYASPEQVRGEPLTTASDTYQLGLILYELLTGGRPYTVKGLSPSDAERVICETVPARPSVFVFTARVETPLTRLVRPDRLGKRLKGDLDTIILKALHKDPARGYASADNMASDIERHRTGRPILARPDTLAYRARKFVQRNRWGVLAATVVFLSLLTGLAGTLWQAERATANALRAESEQRKAEQVTDFVMGLFEANDPSVAQGDTITARQLLEQGVERAEALQDQPELQATLFGVTGRVFRTLGNVARAGDLFRRSLDAWEQIGPRPEIADERAQVMLDYSTVLYMQNAHGEAERLLREILANRPSAEAPDEIRRDALFGLFEVLHTTGQRDAADSAFAAWEAAMDATPPTSDVEGALRMISAAEVLGNGGQMRGDVDAIRRAKQLTDRALTTVRAAYGPRHPMVGHTMNRLLTIWAQEDGLEPSSAETLMEMDSLSRQAVALHRAIYQDPHDALATSLYSRSNILRRLGHHDEAEEAALEGLAINEMTRPQDADPRIVGLYHLAEIAFDRGEYAESASAYREIRDLRANLYGDDYLLTLTASFLVSDALTAAGDFEEAESTLLATYKALESQRGRDDRFTQRGLQRLVDLYVAWDRPDEADRFRARLVESEPSDSDRPDHPTTSGGHPSPHR